MMKISGLLCVLAIAAAIGVLIFAPSVLRSLAGFGILILVLCPLSMAFMMAAKRKS